MNKVQNARSGLTGSYTIEMALIMPIILGLLYGVICLSFLGYDRIVLRGMAYGSVVSAELREQPVLLVHQQPDIEWQEEAEAVSIRYRAQAEIWILRLAGLTGTTYETSGTAERQENDPVAFVRKCRLAERIWEGAGQ